MTMIAERPASSPVAPAEPDRVEEVTRWRWTRADYHRAADLGLFRDLRVELLDGEVLLMAGQKTPHFTAVRFAEALLSSLFETGYEVRAQGPIVLSDDSEPEPDIVVVPGTARDYAGHHPTPSEILLLVEVSDATLATDRGAKRTAYAREGIAEYWIVNLVNRQLEIHREPSPLPTGYGYKTMRTLLEGDTIAPLFASDHPLAVADLLPPVAL